MDGLSLTKLLHLVSERLKGAKLNRAVIAPDALSLACYTPNGLVTLVLSASITSAPWFAPAPERAGVVDEKLSVVHGASITAVTPATWDRRFSLTLKKRKPSGKVVAYDLVFELMGRPAAAFLVSDAGRITWRLNDVSVDADRDTAIGALYQPPKANKRYSLDNPGDAASFMELTGFAPHTAQYAEQLMQAWRLPFDESVEKVRSLILDDPLFYLDEKNRLVPFKFADDAKSITVDELASILAAPKQSAPKKSFRNRLTGFYAKEAKRLTKLIAALEKDLEKAKTWPRLAEKAELFKANFAALEEYFRKGGELRLTRYTENGVEEIAAEPPEAATNAKEAVASLFRKAGKLERSVPILEERLMQARQMLASATDMLHNIAEIDDEAALAELAEEIDAATGKKKRGDGKKRKKDEPFTAYRLPGATAWSGSSSVNNHRLVFSFAKPEDTWLHARNIPSTHVILRTDDGAEPTDEMLMAAAGIVAAKSKAKMDKTVPVDVTKKKYVKHPKGTPPGYVIYDRFSTVDAPPMDEAAMAKLFFNSGDSDWR